MARKRTAFQPTGWEALEERVVLSKFSDVFAQDPVLNALGITSSPKAPKPTVTVGTLGDSYTDEYRFYPPDQSHARNWVEILSSTRKAITFGPFTTASRGEPRNQGFAFNWARFGATTSDMVQNQLPGLRAQVARGQVKFAWIFIGGNDFLYFLRNVQTGQIAPGAALSTLPQVTAQAETNFATAFTTLLAANPRVRLVVATVPDVAELPVVKAGNTSAQTQAVIQAASQAIQQYNASITTLANANSKRVALVDLAAQSALLAGATSGSVPFGGTTINLTTPGDNFHDFFLADGIHIGTVAQGIIADDFINALDTQFGLKLPALSPTRIVAFARSFPRSAP